ncbi:MerR family transcriptional regulator [Massilia sp. WF1]|uniref:MerR family transcriptional regulator n=1 Tax=unclassified Massilia TaxID=2609279 RepID=UPI00064964A0|nr:MULTISPECIES: MerR family transcriptional regulator [unclassified Massilia]ALK98245.1 MerR family transcriptional regulator [Massilia sp. WG5]KLU37178.1 MerR family transcriptional regulator [Massilia sp. WF1]
MTITQTTLSIAAVERETRLSKDVLRVWERRYGFPQPERDANGERSYPAEQVERLRLMKRLMDQGHRPGALAALAPGELAALAAPELRAAADEPQDGAIALLLDLIRERDPIAARHALRQALARQGLERFVEQTVAPLTAAVGLCWEDGSFDVFDEHFYTESVESLLRQAIADLPGARQGPRILLTTVPGEGHGLGLLMAEAMLSLEGATCISLGTETPLLDIARAAAAYGTGVVALSFSAAYPRRQLAPALAQLRQLLPPAVELWAGGAGVARLDAVDGVQLLPTLDSGRQALAALGLKM